MYTISSTQTELLSTLKNKVISGQFPDELEIIKNKIHRSKTNYEFHKTQILNKIEWFKQNHSEHKGLVSILSRVSYNEPNVIDIDVCIAKSEITNDIKLFFIGRDLADCFTFLPKFKVTLSNGKTIIISPQKGAQHCRIYPYMVSNKLIEIGINLRLLELYARENNMTTGFLKKSTHLIGSVIPFDIPKQFLSFNDLTNPNEINSQDNPVKIRPGIFLYGNNGLKNGVMTQMLSLIFEKYPHYEQMVLKFPLLTFDLTKVLSSDVNFFFTSWDKHQRLLIKIPKSQIKNNINIDNTEEESDGSKSDSEGSISIKSINTTDINEPDFKINIDKLLQYEVWIIDPWKKYVSDKILNKLRDKNPYTTFKFIRRSIKDQDKEGSCSMCSLARLLYLLATIYPNNAEPNIKPDILLSEEYIRNLNTPIPDFYAYLVKYLYRHS